MAIKDVSGGRGVPPSVETINSKLIQKADSSSQVQKSEPLASSSKAEASDKISLSNAKKPNIEQVANEALSKVKSQKLSELGSIAKEIERGHFDKASVRADLANKMFKDIGRLEATFIALQSGELERFDQLKTMDLSAHSATPEVMRTTVDRIIQELKKL